MKQPESAHIEDVRSEAPVVEEEMLIVEPDDLGNLDRVLRGYYLGQIKQIERRKERRKARKLIENHLVLPKSRQRTSKDGAYIQEMLGIESPLLRQLEESRLIRRLNKSGHNPIYEVSHDTLVEPILAERSNREAIILFFRKYGRWFLLLLLLLFGFGMLFENWFDVVDDSLTLAPPPARGVALEASNGIVAEKGTHEKTLIVPFNQIKDFRRNDSLTLYVGVNVTAHPELDQQSGGDTIALNLGPVPLNLPAATVQRLIANGKDTALPVRVMIPMGGTPDSSGLMADVAGTALLRLIPETNSRSIAGLGPNANQRTRGSGQEVVQANLGREAVQAGANARTVSLDTTVVLADLISGDQMARDVLKGKSLRLTYQVEVAPAPKQGGNIEYLPVAGIEVQYPDGTKRFIPSAPGAADQPVNHTVQPGETLYKISKLYGVPPEQIKQLNKLQGNTIKVGDVLKVR